MTKSAEPRRQTDAPPHQPLRPLPSSLTVLILEDESGIRHSLARYLHGRGYAVKEASDIDRALAALHGGGIQAIILDVGVPDPTGLGRTGLEVLAHLHEGGRSASPSVIVFTGYPLTKSQATLISRHGARILYKPATYASVCRHLEELTLAA